MLSKSSIWGKIDFDKSGKILTLAENRSIIIRKEKGEVLVTNRTENEDSINKYITGDKHKLFLEPSLPDLPIILNPQHNISIIPGEKLNAYVEIPFTVKILYGSSHKKNTLCEMFQKPLSKSFFGNSETGEFAYLMDSPLHQNISDYQNISSSIYCPLSIANNSSHILGFEKMIFRVPYLSIYQEQDLFIASRVNITFSGHEQVSQIVYKKTPPSVKEDVKLLAHPRMAEDKNLLKKSFYFIKNLYTG